MSHFGNVLYFSFDMAGCTLSRGWGGGCFIGAHNRFRNHLCGERGNAAAGRNPPSSASPNTCSLRTRKRGVEGSRREAGESLICPVPLQCWYIQAGAATKRFRTLIVSLVFPLLPHPVSRPITVIAVAGGDTAPYRWV